MIGVTARNALGPIELFCHNQAHKLMGEYKGRERPHNIGTSDKLVGHSIGTTDHTDNPAASRLECLKLTR